MSKQNSISHALAGLESGASLDETSRALLQQAAQLHAAVAAHELTPDRRRELARQAALLLLGPDTPSVGSTNLQIPLVGRALPARLYEPQTLSSDVLLVFFHGGGWVVGDLETHHPSVQLLAHHLQMKVLSVQYRKAPEHRFPAPCDDAEQALAWAHAHLAQWGCLRIAVGGDSAGGHLAAVAMHTLHAAHTLQVAGALLFYPVTDMQFLNRSYAERGSGIGLTGDGMRWFWQQFIDPERPLAQLAPSEDPRAVPMQQRWAQSPPTLILAAWHDPLYDESVSYARLLAEAGAAVVLQSAPDLAHGFLRHAALVESARNHVLAAIHAFRGLIRA